MSDDDVHTELKKVQTLMEEWIQQIILVVENIQQDIPSDVKTLEQRIDKESQKANTDLYEGFLASMRALGADTKDLESRLDDENFDLKNINDEMKRLMDQNPKLKELNTQLVERTQALLSKPQVISVLIGLVLEAVIQMLELIRSKLEVEAMDDSKSSKKAKKVQAQVDNVKRALDANCQAMINICKAIKESSPTDAESAHEAVMAQMGPIIEAFKQVLTDILKAFKALGGKTYLLEKRVDQITLESPVLVLSPFELAMVVNVNLNTKELRRRLQNELETISNSPDIEKRAVQIGVEGLLVALRTIREAMKHGKHAPKASSALFNEGDVEMDEEPEEGKPEGGETERDEPEREESEREESERGEHEREEPEREEPEREEPEREEPEREDHKAEPEDSEGEEPESEVRRGRA